jgi:hypothetical protein
VEVDTQIYKVLDLGEGWLVPGLVCKALFWWLLRFYLFTMLTILHRGLGVAVVSRGVLICMRMLKIWR